MSMTFIRNYLYVCQRIAEKVSIVDVNNAIDLLFNAWKNQNSVFIAGNGGSASTSSHFASDLNKYVDNGFKTFALVDNIPLISALTNDQGWSEIYSKQLENFMKEGDVFVVISVHGGSGSDKAGPWSQNLMKGTKVARGKKGKIIALTGFDGGPLKSVADVSIIVPSESTPQIEGFHLVLTHLICERLKEMIQDT